MIAELPLSKLRRCADNARTWNINPDDLLIDSIAINGILQPIAVRKAGKLYEVVDGARRLAALQRLIVEDRIAADLPVPVHVLKDDIDAGAASLTANIARRAMHPLDEFKAFSAMSERGMSEKAIARQFAISPQEVRQRIALGRLCDEAKDAWYDEKIDMAEAQLLATHDTDAQRDALAKYLELKEYQQNIWQLRNLLRGDTYTGSHRLVQYVGLDAYKAAGGTVTEDLFALQDADSVIVHDVELVHALASKQIDEAIRTLAAEGYACVMARGDVPDHVPWWKMEIAADDAPPEQVTLLIGVKSDGTLGIERRAGDLHAMILEAQSAPEAEPGDTPAASEPAKPAEPVEPEPDTLHPSWSKALSKDMAPVLNAYAISDAPAHAIIALFLAQLTLERQSSCNEQAFDMALRRFMPMRDNPAHAMKPDMDIASDFTLHLDGGGEYQTLLERARGIARMSAESQIGLLAALVRPYLALDERLHTPARKRREMYDYLCPEQDVLYSCLYEPGPEYFGRLKKPALLEHLAHVCTAEEMAGLSKAKASELATIAERKFKAGGTILPAIARTLTDSEEP